MSFLDHRKITTCLLIYALNFSLISDSMAHSTRPPGSAPVSVVDPISGAVEQNRGGYGFLNASSEVEADSLFRHECPTPNNAGNISICIPRNTGLETAYNLAGHNFEAAFTSMALDNSYEQLILQRAAVSPNSNTWNLPSCISASPRAQQMKSDVEAIKGKTDFELNTHITDLTTQIDNILAVPAATRTAAQNTTLENLQRRRLAATKLRATKQSFDTNRMAEAFLLDKQLAAAQARTCVPANPEPRKCMSIRRNRDRMRLAFPSVFPGGLAQMEGIAGKDDRTRWEEKSFASTLEGANRCGTHPYNRFESSMYKLMGYHGAANPIPGAGTGSGTGSAGCAVSDQDNAAILQGSTQVSTAFSQDAGYTDIVSTNDNNSDGNADGTFTFASNEGQLASVDISFGIGAGSDPRLASAFDAMKAAADEMKSVQELEAAMSMSTFCQERRNLADIARLQPQAMRQAVLDQNNDRSREALTNLMCQKGVMAQFQSDDQTLDCGGVNGDPTAAAGMRIARTNYGFPFVSDSNYTLKTLPDGSTEVSTKINYQFKFDPSISPGSPGYRGNAHVPAANRKTRLQQETEFNTNTAAWVQSSTTFLNAQAGTIGDPKVTFKIEQCMGCAASVTPNVEVSECYTRVMPASFPTDFPGQTWNAHRCWYKNGARTFNDWQDAGGFTTTMDNPTIMHETGHNLGLADEYVADYYPAHPVGENGATGCNNSTMAANNATCNVLYRRHLLEMIRPSRVCPKPRPPTP